MRIIAITLNIALFLIGIMTLFNLYPWDNKEIIVLSIVIGCSLVNLYILTHVYEEVSWLSLFLKRKTLEEKERIEKHKHDIESMKQENE
jgi:hypothetical protein